MFFLRHDLTAAPGEPQSKPQLTGWDLKEVLDPLDGGSSTREDVAAPRHATTSQEGFGARRGAQPSWKSEGSGSP